MQAIEEILNNTKLVMETGAQVRVDFVVKDDGKQENYSIDVGPADFRATLKFSDFEDLKNKLDAYEKSLAYAREKGIAAPAKVPKN